MTELRINMKAFKEACEYVREQMKVPDELTQRVLSRGIRRFYEAAISDDWRAPEVEEEQVIDPVESLRAALNVAAMAAQQYGATQAQINYIVSLAVAQNDFNILSGGRLTKSEASRIIDAMKGN